MGFEMFDLADLESAPPPQVRVDVQGVRLNRRALELFGAGTQRVILLFDREERLAQVQAAASDAPGTAVFDLVSTRNTEWPALVRARQFVKHYRLPVRRVAATVELGRVTFGAVPGGPELPVRS